MRKTLLFLIAGALACFCFTGLPLQAQNAVANPFFSTTDLQHWTCDDPSLTCNPGSINLGMNGYCMRKSPGAPDDNGAATQEIHLIAGNTYQFSANIASMYNCPG